MGYIHLGYEYLNQMTHQKEIALRGRKLAGGQYR